MFDVQGFILVGGASRRMGQDKAQLRLGPETMLERIAAQLSPVTSSVTLVGSPQAYVGHSLPTVPDVYEKWGALGGIHATLSAAKADWVIVVACDLPFVTRDLFERLESFAKESPFESIDAIVPIQPDGRPQPVCALYRRATCLPEIERLVSAGEHTPRALLTNVRTRYVQFEELNDLPGSENFFLNLNTPEDFDRAKWLAETVGRSSSAVPSSVHFSVANHLSSRIMRIMSSRRGPIRRIARTFLPIVLILLIAVVVVTGLIVYNITRPTRAAYLVTPQSFTLGPILKANDATWPNHDGTQARGWLIKGDEGAPAVILLHRYGADRSTLLNLAVKLNESTGFTVLWPDLRGHGLNPPVNWTLFGAIEGDDATAAIDYLHTLKTTAGQPHVGLIGIFGVELGAYAALDAAKRYPEVRALALDSAPGSPDDLVRSATGQRTAMSNVLFQKLGCWGMRAYAWGKYQSTPSCEVARALRNVKVQLLTGPSNDPWYASTLELANCFSGGAVEVKKDLQLTGMNLNEATGEQEEAYARPVIEFFKNSLK